MNQNTDNTQNIRKYILFWIKITFLFILLLFVGRSLYLSILEVTWSRFTIRPYMIANGALIVCATTLIGSSILRNLYGQLGSKLVWPQAFVLLTIPPIGKYLPGKMLSLAGAAIIARSFGIRVTVSSSATLLIMILGLTSATLIGATVMLIQAPVMIGGDFIPSILVGVTLVFVIILLHPRTYWKTVNFILNLFKQTPIEVNLDFQRMLALFLGLLVHNGLNIGGMSLMLLGFVDLPISMLPIIIGASSLATVAGFLTLFAPAGIGVREGVLLVILVPIIGTGNAGVATIMLRLIQTSMDILLAILGFLALHSFR